MLGENGRGEKVFFLHLPMATKLETFHWLPNMEPSIGHQALDPPLSPFSFSLKGGFGSLGGSLASEEFSHNLEYLFSTTFLKRQIMISLSRGKKEGK